MPAYRQSCQLYFHSLNKTGFSLVYFATKKREAKIGLWGSSKQLGEFSFFLPSLLLDRIWINLLKMWCGFLHDSERNNTENDEGKDAVVLTHGPLTSWPPGPLPNLRLPPRCLCSSLAWMMLFTTTQELSQKTLPVPRSALWCSAALQVKGRFGPESGKGRWIQSIDISSSSETHEAWFLVIMCHSCCLW